MKKCIFVSDSFKGTLSCLDICNIARQTVPEFFPGCEVVAIPMADGGEGTVDCFIQALGAKSVRVEVSDPCGKRMNAEYAVYGEGSDSFVFMTLGTGVGGGTLLGLSKRLLGMDNITHIEQLAAEGNLGHVDLKINDITKHVIVPVFSDTMTASNFGNVSDIATRGDIALGLCNMVFETIGMISIFAARNYGIRDIVLTGNLSSVAQAEEVFSTLNRMFDMRFTIPQNSRFGTVIGAALAGF